MNACAKRDLLQMNCLSSEYLKEERTCSLSLNPTLNLHACLVSRSAAPAAFTPPSLLSRATRHAFDGCTQVAGANLGRVRTGRFQQVGEKAAHVRDLQTRILEHGTRWAGYRQVAASDFDPARNRSDSIADLVDLPGSNLSDCSQMFRPRNLAAVQLVKLVAAVAQLLDHVVELTAENSRLVAAIGEVCRRIQISIADARHLVLKVRR